MQSFFFLFPFFFCFFFRSVMWGINFFQSFEQKCRCSYFVQNNFLLVLSVRVLKLAITIIYRVECLREAGRKTNICYG